LSLEKMTGTLAQSTPISDTLPANSATR